MKYLLSTLLILSCICGFAQNVPKPDFANQPMAWNKADNTLIKLEKENIGMASKMKGAFYTFEGTQSAVRISSIKGHTFIIQAGMQMDPSAITTLYRLDVKKKYRQAAMATKASAFSTKATTETDDVVAYDLKKLTDDTYEIVIAGPLTPGEYAFVVGGVGYSFGIDG